jgi:hypothetical protein
VLVLYQTLFLHKSQS